MNSVNGINVCSLYLVIKPATDDSDVHERQKTCATRKTYEKKGRAQENAKIDYTRFSIQLFSRTIKFYLLSHEKIPSSHA